MIAPALTPGPAMRCDPIQVAARGWLDWKKVDSEFESLGLTEKDTSLCSSICGEGVR